MSKKTVALVLGTRPEIIKLAPIIRFMRMTGRRFFMVHTGQHYSYEMDRVFFKELDLPEPMCQLSVPSGSPNRHGCHTGRMMAKIEEVLLKERPGTVLVQGDTNTVLAGSLVVSKMNGMKLGHVEAGLRSYDRDMPEEINRVVSDHVSDYLFAPTPAAKKILIGEAVPNEKIFVTGNTIVDAVRQNLAIAKKKVALSSIIRYKKDAFFLMTMHRQENVDQENTLRAILRGLAKVSRCFKTPIIFSIHPRTRARLKAFGLKLPSGVEALSPVGFLEFLRLEESAGMILTDSGGVQEEACILKIPCVTLRTTTERPETVTVGANRVAGHDPENILHSAREMMRKKRSWANPFGDGCAGERIIRIIEKGRR